MGKSACIAALAALFCTSAGAAAADTLVIGGGFANACSDAANAQALGKQFPELRKSRSGVVLPPIEACNRALQDEVLGLRDIAATHVNRGVLLMGAGDYAAAQADFETALRLKPDMAEARANRGGAMISQRQYREGVEELTAGIAMQPAQLEKSYYNRAIGQEALGDLKSAYLDYLKASELKPEWQAPKDQLTRFTVRRR